jgi:hypothetical protein
MITPLRRILLILFCAVLFPCLSKAQKTNTSPVIDLLQPENFYSFLKDFGLNKDDDHVFNWVKPIKSSGKGAEQLLSKSGSHPILHITGQHYGYIATKKEFSNYRLIAEYKWGPKTWAPRENNARDGGVLCHFVGKDQVWPKSLEAQIIEGGTGDILVVSGAFLTVDGVRKGPAIARFDRPGRNPWEDVKGFRGPSEIEKPAGEWNTMEVFCGGDHFGITVNGHKTLEGTNAVPSAGKILVQSEGAEIFFRRLDLIQLP